LVGEKGVATERNLNGGIAWQFQVDSEDWAVIAERQADGNTCLLTTKEASEINVAKQVIWSYERRREDSARLVCRWDEKHVLWEKPRGELEVVDVVRGEKVERGILKRRPERATRLMGVHGNRYLLKLEKTEELELVDAEGDTLWRVTVPRVYTAQALPGGQTLVESGTDSGVIRLSTFDRSGRRVAESLCEGPESRLRSCLDLVRLGFTPGTAAVAEQDPVAFRIKQLGSNNLEARRRGAGALRELGGKGRTGIPALIKALGDADSEVRNYAAAALEQFGDEAQEAVPGLIELLSDSDRGVRATAASALSAVGEAAVPAIMKAARDKREQVRAGAVLIAIKLVRPPEEVARMVQDALVDDSSIVRECAVHALGRLRAPSPNVVRSLMIAAKDKEPEVRSAALLWIGELGRSASEAAPLVSRVVTEDNTSSVRKEGVRALAKLGDSSDRVVTGLLRCLAEDRDSTVRESAAEALGTLGRNSDIAIRELIIAVRAQDGSPGVRAAAAEALGTIGPKAKAGIPALVEALQTSRDGPDAEPVELWRAAAWALGEMGQEAKPGVAALATLLAKELPPEKEKNFRSARLRAIESLGKLRSAAKDSIPTLAEILKNDQQPNEVREAVAMALSNIGPEGVSALAELVRSRTGRTGRLAVRALGRIRPVGKAALTSLMDALKQQKDRGLREDAKWALIDAGPEPAIAPLLEMLRGESMLERACAVDVLAAFGSKAKKAIPALLRASEDLDTLPKVDREEAERLRQEIAKAIRDIQGGR
jgi:HEAT repeat protein